MTKQELLKILVEYIRSFPTNEEGIQSMNEAQTKAKQYIDKINKRLWK